MNNTCAIYARVSTEKQEKQETVASQLSALREYASKNDYVIFDEYVDVGFSGELLDRPGLDKLRDDVKNRLFNIVIVHSPDRLSRKFIHYGLVEEELKKYDMKVVYLNRPDSKDTPEDNLLNGIQGLIAEYEKAKILERTRRGKLHRAKNNIIIGSIAPYGYKYITSDKNHNIPGHYEINESETRVVKLIFKLYVQKNFSIRKIAKELTQRGIHPRKGIKWRTSSLHKIIRNETYTGITYYNKNASVEAKSLRKGKKYRRSKNTGRILRAKDQWIPITLPENLKIIGQEVFESAQNLLSKHSEMSPRNVKYQYLLRGLLRCGQCDSPFYGTPCHGTLFYRCGNRHRTFPMPKECKVGMISARIIEKVVWEKFCEVIENPNLIMKQIVLQKEKVSEKWDKLADEIASLNKELIKIEDEGNRILDAYRENAISLEQLRIQMHKIQERKTHIEHERQTLIQKQENAISLTKRQYDITNYCKLIKNRLRDIKLDFDSMRYLLSLAINKITIDGNKITIRGIVPLNKNVESLSNIVSILH